MKNNIRSLPEVDQLPEPCQKFLECLDYAHTFHPSGPLNFICQYPENPSVGAVAYDHRCKGCTIGMVMQVFYYNRALYSPYRGGAKVEGDNALIVAKILAREATLETNLPIIQTSNEYLTF